MDMDRIHVEETKRQHREKSSKVESSMTKEERQTKQHLEKRSRAGDEGGRGHMGFTRSSSAESREVETVRWWPMLNIRSDRLKSSKSSHFQTTLVVYYSVRESKRIHMLHYICSLCQHPSYRAASVNLR